MKGIFAELTGKNRFERLDFVLLKTALMLAAADGEVAADEEREVRQVRMTRRVNYGIIGNG